MMFGDALSGAATLLAVMGAGSALAAVGFSMEPVMLTVRKEKALFASSLVSAAAFYIAIWPLMGAYGLLGAGLALLLRQVVLFLHRLFVLYRTLVLRPARKDARR